MANEWDLPPEPKPAADTSDKAQRIVSAVAGAGLMLAQTGALPPMIAIPLLAGTTLASALLPALGRRKDRKVKT
jgi:hypothetical protein